MHAKAAVIAAEIENEITELEEELSAADGDDADDDADAAGSQVIEVASDSVSEA